MIFSFFISRISAFDILFDHETYSGLSLVSADTINWDGDTDVWQPDNVLGEEEDGTLDALAQVISDSLTGSFTVTFIYTGEALPGVQDVQYFDTDWNVTATGQTSAVPVPGSFIVLFSGIAGLCALKRKF
nr:hypothetical protein [uncultured Desulfobacter sp.]